MNKNSLEEQLRKLEEKMNLEPSRQTWGKIQSQLQIKKDKKRLFYRMIWLQSAAVLLLVFGLCFIAYFMNQSRTKNSPIAVSRQQKSVDPPEIIAPSTSNKTLMNSEEQLVALPKTKVNPMGFPQKTIPKHVESSPPLVPESKSDQTIMPIQSTSKSRMADSNETLLWPKTIRSPYYGKLNGTACYANIKSTSESAIWTINKQGNDQANAKLVFQKEGMKVLLVANFEGRVYVFDMKSELDSQWTGISRDSDKISLSIVQNEDSILLDLKDNSRSIEHKLELQPTYE